MTQKYLLEYELTKFSKTPGFIVSETGRIWGDVTTDNTFISATDDLEAGKLLTEWKRDKEKVPCGEDYFVARRKVSVLGFYRLIQVPFGS
jgi:hypothetical protein